MTNLYHLDDEIVRRHGEGQGVRQIARDLKIDPSTASRALKRLGISARKGIDYLPPIDKDEVRRLYEERVGVDEMSRRFGRGVGRDRILAVLDELGLPRRGVGYKSGNTDNFKGKRYAPYAHISIGDRFGLWEVTGESYFRVTPAGKNQAMFPCRCDCGTLKGVRAYALVQGLSWSCVLCRPREHSALFEPGSGHPFYKGENGSRAVKRAWLEREKSSPCVDCGNQYPTHVMEFDHVPERGEKIFMINRCTIIKGWSLEDMMEERKKCDLLCANCHKHRTWQRANGLPLTPLAALEWSGANG